jgi:hypothetical protein
MSVTVTEPGSSRHENMDPIVTVSPRWILGALSVTLFAFIVRAGPFRTPEPTRMRRTTPRPSPADTLFVTRRTYGRKQSDTPPSA